MIYPLGRNLTTDAIIRKYPFQLTLLELPLAKSPYYASCLHLYQYPICKLYNIYKYMYNKVTKPIYYLFNTRS